MQLSFLAYQSMEPTCSCWTFRRVGQRDFILLVGHWSTVATNWGLWRARATKCRGRYPISTSSGALPKRKAIGLDRDHVRLQRIDAGVGNIFGLRHSIGENSIHQRYEIRRNGDLQCGGALHDHWTSQFNHIVATRRTFRIPCHDHCYVHACFDGLDFRS